jgi:hypothetical protein
MGAAQFGQYIAVSSRIRFFTGNLYVD